LTQNRVRDVWIWPWLQDLWQDVRFALRLSLRDRWFTIAVVATLALGISATTAVFSVVYHVVLRPLPYADPARLVRVSEVHPGAPAAPLRAANLSNLTYFAWQDAGLKALEGLGAYGVREYIVGFSEGTALIQGASASPVVFSLLRAVPSHGRFFSEDEAVDGAVPVVVLGHRLWRDQFSADPEVLGRSLQLDGTAHTIVGITRPDFQFPDRAAQFWTPKAIPQPVGPEENPSVSVFQAIGRLRPGVSATQAAAEGTQVARSIGESPLGVRVAFGTGGPVEVHVRTFADEMTADVRPALGILVAGVAVFLLIACVNVANLFLFRGVKRERELAIRGALGARTARLAQHLLVEALVLAGVGGITGVVLAWSAIRLLPALALQGIPRLDEVELSGPVLAFAALVSLTTAIACGLAPVLRSLGRQNTDALRQSGAGLPSGVGARARYWVRDGLLVLQSSFAVALLICGMLLAESFARLMQVDPGYTYTQVLTAELHIPGGAAAAERRGVLVSRLLERLRALPDVVAAGTGNMMPLDSVSYLTGFPVRPIPEPDGARPVVATARSYGVTPGYAEALGLRLRAGRFFREADAAASALRMIVNEEFARLYLPREPVGTRLHWGERTAEIIGIVGNVLKDGNDRQPQPEIYGPLGEGQLYGTVPVVMRTTGNPEALAPLLRGYARELASDVAVEVLPLADRMSLAVSRPRFTARLLMSFALLSFLLAALGLYSMLSYVVSSRRHELGIRAAVGATRRDLVWLVVRRGVLVSLGGLFVGLAVAANVAPLMSSLLFGVAPLDPRAFVAAPALLVPVAVAACLVPAFRAASVNPAGVLHSE
jgi:predicted permease